MGGTAVNKSSNDEKMKNIITKLKREREKKERILSIKERTKKVMWKNLLNENENKRKYGRNLYETTKLL